MMKLAIDRGNFMWGRYLLFVFVMILPFGALVISRYLKNRTYVLIIAVLLAVTPIFISQRVNKPDLYIVKNAARGIEPLGRWLADSPFQDSPLLLTKMSWDSTYLPLYRPEIAFRYIIVSDWLRDDSHLRDFILGFQPQLLITRDGESKHISRIEKFIGAKIPENRLIYDQHTIKAYDLRGLYRETEYSIAPINRCVPVGPDFRACPNKR